MTAHTTLRGDVAILIPAAGTGERLGPGPPKALRELAGEPLLVHAVRQVCLAPCVGMIVVAAPPAQVPAVTALLAAVAPVTVVAGGVSRQASVSVALASVPERFDIVLVHDAARALAPPALVDRVVAAVRAGHGAVIPVLPVVDTIKQVGAADLVMGTVDRSVLRAVQTPQGFRRELLAEAHRAAIDDLGRRADHTDDAGLVEKIGHPVHCVPGDVRALKVTHPIDLVVAEALLRAGTLSA
ncbi:MAG: 2-C-methyl-D-erythritol 4-phosphate cytidylyltransferase [Micromonosporaceae bacterium]|nr:2-C-methyl-D-erythritol 4-phosphate cytidylyltransferase [Micromonosporaceae bacterium]